MNKEEICYRGKFETINKKKVVEEFGGIIEKRKKVQNFLKQKKVTEPIRKEDLGKYDTALFQPHLNPNPYFQEYSFEDILVDYQIDQEKGTVTAKKLIMSNRMYELVTRVYDLENYNRTWRAWAALPTREAARWE